MSSSLVRYKSAIRPPLHLFGIGTTGNSSIGKRCMSLAIFKLF
ncbi:hypothetical protein LEP1GSC071_0661, partial [Leptospira santarosai str. JET]